MEDKLDNLITEANGDSYDYYLKKNEDVKKEPIVEMYTSFEGSPCDLVGYIDEEGLIILDKELGQLTIKEMQDISKISVLLDKIRNEGK